MIRTKIETANGMRIRPRSLGMAWCATALSLIFLSCASRPAQDNNPISPDRLSWMTGYWAGVAEGIVSEEFWFPPRGTVMLGLHVDRFPSGSTFFEYLRIENQDGTLVLMASPRGRPPTAFTATEETPSRIVFSNLAHDYPQNIAYSMAGPDSLRAEVWGSSDGSNRGSTWVWGRANFPVD